MSRNLNKMICPNCGAEMNHHSDKIVYTMGSAVEAANTSAAEEVYKEFHSCPACGASASR